MKPPQVQNNQLFSTPGSYAPACCPEGVFSLASPAPMCGCKDNLNESPYRLTAELLGTTPSGSIYDYKISTVPTTVNQNPYDQHDCSAMDMEKLRLYLRPGAAADIVTATFNGVTVPWTTFDNSSSQQWVEFHGLNQPYTSVGAIFDLQIVTNASLPSLCATNSLGSSQCEYVTYGQWNLTILDYSCCSHGFSEVAYLPDGNECGCDDNPLRSPYNLALASLLYTAATNVTSITFNLNYNVDLCDPASECCNTDVKTVLIVMSNSNSIVTLDTSEFSSYDLLPTGIKVYGTFGNGINEYIKIGVAGRYQLAQLCPGTLAPTEGCPYQLQGGYSYNLPFQCCPVSQSGAI